MKKTMRKLGALMLALALVLSGISIVGPAVTGTDTVYAAKTVYYVKVTKLEVHKKASESSKVVKTLKQGKKVVKAGQIDDNGWVKIRYADEKYGYAKRDDLTTKKKKATSETAATTSELEKIGKEEFNKVIKVAKENGWTIDSKTWYYGPREDYPNLNKLDSYIYISNSRYHCDIEEWSYEPAIPATPFYDVKIWHGNREVERINVAEISVVVDKIKEYAD